MTEKADEREIKELREQLESLQRSVDVIVAQLNARVSPDGRRSPERDAVLVDALLAYVKARRP